MIQVLQSLRTGVTELADVPVPFASGNTILVETRASVISPGTERMVVDFGRAGWLEKARSQPDKVRQVFEKVKTDGLAPTLEAVRAKLDAPVPIGYCQAGVVRESGGGVTAFAPGDRVVTNGPHAEYVRVAHTLAARIPAAVSFEAAAFAPLAAIALQGLRLANPTLGETAVVFGLGPIGLLAVQLARATGCQVIGIDRDDARCALAERFGARTVSVGAVDPVAAVREMTGGVGADMVLLTLASDSDEPVHQAAEMSRKRGRIVLTGVTGLDLRRDDFYRKELSFQVSCSYGPGRYDPVHEESGVDYPLPYVRWTEARNFEAVLGLMADGRLDPLPLISHRFPIGATAAAYDLISSGAPALGVVLTYAEKETAVTASARTIELAPRRGKEAGNVGFIGSGNFASRVLIPAFAQAGANLDVLASSGGVSAAVVGNQRGFRRLTTDAATVLGDSAVDTIVVATRHDSHADWVVRGLEAGKNVFVEKPLALTPGDLHRIEAAARAGRGILCVGFNRRFARDTLAARKALSGRIGPLAISVTVNAGVVPPEHWTQNQEIGGGRIVGEACHFIDLCRFLVGAAIERVEVVSARARDGRAIDDVAMIQLSFADGSVGAIQYLANGSKAMPKERLELHFDGKSIRLDNFKKISAVGIPGLSTALPKPQDKGHAALVASFMESVRSGRESPIPLAEILEVSAISIEAGRLARTGGGGT
jgi:predicted dehydrogenase/threonine dehydrogenase-like Zn-dependent dehydrogenase